MRKNPVLLMYCKEETKRQKIRKLCQQFGMECQLLSVKDGKEEIGVLSGVYEKAMRTHEMPPFAWQIPELIVFSGLPESRLHLFLDAYRKEGLEPIALKAIVTPHNVMWSIYELSNELASEHEKMHSQR